VRSRDPEVLLPSARAGDRGALARLLTLVERGGDPARVVARLCHPLAGTAHTIGLTGAPGAGKSTLTDAVISHLRSIDEDVAVLCVDPSSPFTGGAILGDRVRMQGHAGDDGVYIRSMASRGQLGGLSLATPEAVRVLDAVGIPLVVIETVGVGQVEVEIAGTADTTVVVVNPGWGDAVQANKAGLMEIADIFVVNKADRPGAEATARDLDQMLEMTMRTEGGWRPPILATSAVERRGIGELWEAIGAHRAHLETTGEGADRRRRRLATELRAIVVHTLERRAAELAGGDDFDRVLARVVSRETDPWTAADEVLAEL
jgi:LAO/AO transport system kinase